ncbi:LacI family DNA-binding transcriptional regulator [Vibrio sp. T187]|uniref:LacI family DNA-binding transcriptional regulator n=1 Tax=Vibrio TaxID=662 RepID=UPI0010C94F22|nr:MULTISPECIES: substrate-binding domain-containing protein [Vibrio]MBW3696175.1 LacI family DNA-binding transcriptional regulator [Vibrio sp. T187]
MSKKVTIHDVAQRANVSPSTISRYLNRTSYIAKDKVDSIEKAIFDLGFKAKKRKSQPETKRTMTLGIVTASYDSPHITRILMGMDEMIHQHSYQLIVETTHWQPNREEAVLKQFINQNVDGIIVVGGYLSERAVKEITGKKPVLLFGSPVFLAKKTSENLLPQLQVDNELGGYLATNHLLQLGHRRILHLHGTVGNIDAEERLQGYKRSLEMAGITVDEQLICAGNFEAKIAFKAMNEFLDKDINFTAIFCANDESAYGAIQAMHQRGISVPDDVSVIGFDDLPFSSFFIPRLTTVKQPFEEMGKIAIRQMLDLISENTGEYSVPPVELISRDSTKRLEN